MNFGLQLADFLELRKLKSVYMILIIMYEGWNFNSGKYLFTTDTK